MIYKYKDLNTEGVSTNLEENDLAIAIISNLLNTAVIKNRWFVNASNTLQSIKNTYKAIASGYYLGAVLRQGRNKEDSISTKWMSYLHSP